MYFSAYYNHVSKSFSISSLFIQSKKSIHKFISPNKRPFLPLQSPIDTTVTSENVFKSDSLSDSRDSFTTSYSSQKFVHANLRILQFNILADGLSGLRSDLGAFSRVKREDILWDSRRRRLLAEIVQYDPDVITLQECDHYYDFFLPELSILGYDGLYSPKPASACLEVSQNADGCCIFLRRKKIRVISAETLTYALSRAEVSSDGIPLSEDDRVARVQNQVALVAICEIVISKNSNAPQSPPIVIATTHLKAMKTSLGERYRLSEARQLLDAISRVVSALERRGRSCAVILTGDLNASPTDETTGYPALAYKLVKNHPLNFRSVLNDDIPVNHAGVLGRLHRAINGNEGCSPADKGSCSEPGVWTTWKARTKKGQEKIARHCIDYILYSRLQSGLLNQKMSKVGIKAVSVLDLYDDVEMSSNYLPNEIYPSDHLAIAADLQIIEEL